MTLDCKNRNWRYDLFGKENESRTARDETINYIKSQNPGGHYSPTGLCESAFKGTLSGVTIGALEGVVSAFAIPLSLRKIKDRLPQNFTEVIDPSKVISTRVFMGAKHMSRLTTRLGIMGLAAYNMVTDADPILLATNTLSLGYELYRSGRKG